MSLTPIWMRSYAAIEQLDDPSLRGRPLLVGPPSARGVVLTASYEARPYGVGSAMPMAQARRLCPNAVIIPPRFDRYQEISETIMNVFSDFSPDVEALSLDEAFNQIRGQSRKRLPKTGRFDCGSTRRSQSMARSISSIPSMGCRPKDPSTPSQPWSANHRGRGEHRSAVPFC